MSALDRVIERIERARLAFDKKHIVKLVAVSKYANINQILKLYYEGQRAFGESKIQDLKQKSAALNEYPIEWHFIGRLQTNKINHLISLKPTLFHALNSYNLACQLDDRLLKANLRLPCLLQVNSAKEPQKAGVMPEEAIETYQKIKESTKNIDLKGLMCIGAHTDNEAQIIKSFEITKKLFDELKDATILSMGMSSDFELAIRCGANLVRIGSLLFEE